MKKRVSTSRRHPKMASRPRKKRPIDLLFPKTRRRILAATVLRPEKWWYLSALARALDAVPQALRRDLNQLVAAGILQQRNDGNRVYFKADPECPILHDLQNVFLKTVGLVDVLRHALKPHTEKITCAFVYGSIARGEELSSSDVDLMIIGQIPLSKIASPLKDAEANLLRPVNPTVYTEGEYAKKLREGRHFITTVHNAEKLFVIGTQDDLESITSGSARPSPRATSGAASRVVWPVRGSNQAAV
jgi:DNA-binding transcriptional ArsR family regulator